MYKYPLIIFIVCLYFVFPVFAEDSDAELLAEYMKDVEVSGIGVCDNFGSTVVFFKTKASEEMIIDIIMLVTASDVRKHFYIVKKEWGKEYFIQQPQNNGSIAMKRLSEVYWSAELMLESMNFFNLTYFPEIKQNDCIIKKTS